MATRIGRTMGSQETVFTGRALASAAKGRKLPPETKRALADVTRATDELEVALTSAATAVPQARVDCRDEERDVDAKARALDLLLEAHAALGDDEAVAVRAALFPSGRGFARERGAVKQGELKLVLARAGECSAALARLGAKPFVAALAEALRLYVARLTESVTQPAPKPVRVAEQLAEAHEAMRRYLDIVQARATLSGEPVDEALLAPFAHRAAARRAAADHAVAEPEADTEDATDAAPPSQAA